MNTMVSFPLSKYVVNVQEAFSPLIMHTNNVLCRVASHVGSTIYLHLYKVNLCVSFPMFVFASS